MKIYLDPGHGEGVKGTADPGAVGPTGLTENEVTFDLAKRLGHLLREKGIEVVGATLAAARDDENLNEAIAAANAQEVDLFLSIHCNAAVSPKARGVEAWYGAGGTGQVVAEAVLTRIGEQVAGGKGAWVQGRRYPLVMRTLVVMTKDMRVFPNVDRRRMTMVFPIIKTLERLTLRDFRHIIHPLMLLPVTPSSLARRQ
jgi:N-acetylmuramoyl-L-alanine amidase